MKANRLLQSLAVCSAAVMCFVLVQTSGSAAQTTMSSGVSVVNTTGPALDVTTVPDPGINGNGGRGGYYSCGDMT